MQFVGANSSFGMILFFCHLHLILPFWECFITCVSAFRRFWLFGCLIFLRAPMRNAHSHAHALAHLIPVHPRAHMRASHVYALARHSFGDGTGVAGRRPQRTPSLMIGTSDCGILLRSRHTKRSDTAFSRFVLPTARLLFVACNELAIATRSIASVLSPATRSPWVPSRGGTAIGKTHEERGSCN